MRVTIIADASHCPDTGAAGYGYWIACARGKLGGDGPIMTTSATSTVAEMRALANALHRAVVERLVQVGDAVLLQTDCEAAIKAFDGTRGRLIKEEHEAKEYLNSLKVRFNLSFEFRHVKGHSKIKEARYAANNTCDKRARQAMRKARGQMQINRIKEIVK